MTPQALRIRPFEPADEAPLTAVLTPVFRAGDSYTLDPDLPDAAYRAYWTSPGHEVFVAEDAHGALLGTYYMRPNQGGGGAHVCNCGYITAVHARGQPGGELEQVSAAGLVDLLEAIRRALHRVECNGHVPIRAAVELNLVLHGLAN